MYKRLRTCERLPERLQKQLASEKSPLDALSAAELNFYLTLLPLPLWCNHATNYAERIKKNNNLLLDTGFCQSMFGTKFNTILQPLLLEAIKLQHHVIAKLLITHGVVIYKDAIASAVQYSNRELYHYMQARNTIFTESPSDIKVSIAVQEFYYVLCSESPITYDNQPNTGDVDYAKILANAISAQMINASVHYFNSATLNKLHLLQRTKPLPLVFHLLLNAPRTGFAIGIDDIKRMKQKGVLIIMTAIEYAKHNHENQRLTSCYLELADEVIFLDAHDKNSALLSANKEGNDEALVSANIIPVPSTIEPAYLTMKKIASNIMCFGIIRRGKGFAHILKLAELIKNSNENVVKDKQIYIVGTVLNVNDIEKADSELYRILKAMYPKHASDFSRKLPQELAIWYEHNKHVPCALPIKLFLNVAPHDLPPLFEACEYAYYPAYRGATLRNSSISCELANGCIIYSHITSLTPDELRIQGEGLSP